MSRLIQLPSGTFIAPGAIQMIEARSLMRPHVDHAGQSWPAMVFVETRNQVVRVPCSNFVAAENLRDAIGDLVNASFANAQARRGEAAPTARGAESAPPARGSEAAPPARGAGERVMPEACFRSGTDGASLPGQMMAPRHNAPGAFAEAS